MIPAYINQSKLPHKSGVYLFLDSLKNVLYVGKAIDLRSRVSQYFNSNINFKTKKLIEKIANVETIIVESELEALILEANLIKKYRPIFNVRLMDDKDYLYIGISLEGFPKVITIRKQDLKQVKKFFGPFPSSRTVRDTLKLLRRVFPWCSNPPSSTVQSRRLQAKYRACFYYHLGLCPGACIKMTTKQEYQKSIKRFVKFMEGKKEELVLDLTKEMMDFSKAQEFEQAGKIKKILSGISYLTQQNRIKLYLQNPNFLEDEKKEALACLKKDLNLARIPLRVEGYDISNIGGKEAVGSMVVLTDGEADKSQYRKFKIHPPAGGVGKPNDVAMHKEMLSRRIKHKEWLFPDLILIDGGRAQARVAQGVLQAVNLQIPVFGLAKRMEWLYPPVSEVIKLPAKSLSLRLLRRLRDESHRFAINYHRKLRDKINI